MARAALVIPLMLLHLATSVRGHEHHTDEIPEGEGVSKDPIDTILWIHIAIQMFSFGIIFPTGMVLGIVRSRWHVPLQTVGTVLAVLGYVLGHAHKGRQFDRNVHAAFASSLMIMLLVQVGCGIYLKLHMEKGIHGKIRRFVVMGHGVLGKIMPVVSWTQMVFGGITALGFCRGDHVGQCAAHFIMGSAFIAYGIIMTIMLLVGQMWLRKTGKSQEFFDSCVIAAWGCVNTFTEHRWGTAWVRNDLQHTTMGIVWWCAGLLGIWLSRRTDGSPRRNPIPGMIIFITGYGMSAHPQTLPLSEMIHTVFGYTLMAAGLTRIIEIAFILGDRNTFAKNIDSHDPNSFQYLPPFFLIASGFLFMGATEEQMQVLSDHHVTHVSWLLIDYSLAFLVFLFVNILLHIYTIKAWPVAKKGVATTPNGSAAASSSRPNGHAHTNSDVRALREAEEFELEGLMSDEDEGLDTPNSPAKPVALPR
ncbi:MAG: hypothetical protein M1819_007180 [Sarea resinae]|nr:MAG: hypothetical protein M1819_007180 [Sarea resinae]